ncbi:MAG: hypothetical protein HXS48_07765 [Theionarchaea archaeon]|nr:MAG: hypothetical protein AYK19_03505 [Theionarchaea archaeon DG-70-1]MBU7026823.1 hypothetical protein [Theionarchaea archaeon]
MRAVKQETFDDFQIKNTQPCPLADFFDLDVTVVFMNEKEVREHFQNDAWFELYAKYPFSQGIMTLSRVGFNSEMNQALVYVGNQKEILSGAGYYVLLTKMNGVWIIQDKVMIWIS